MHTAAFAAARKIVTWMNIGPGLSFTGLTVLITPSIFRLGEFTRY